jgi:hypothetical protein
MRNILFVALFSLLSCQTKQSNGYSESTKMDVHPDSISVNKKSKFENQDQSYIKYYMNGKNNVIIRNISYSVNYLNHEHDLDDYIIKQTHQTNSVMGQEGKDSKVILDIFSISDSKLIRTIAKRADDIDISSNFLKSTKYGCCGAEDYSELAEIWQDNTFLTYNGKYYFVDIPNARLEFFLGYLSDARNKDKLIHGELHFAQSFGTLDPNSKYYTNKYRAISKIIFKAKTKLIFDKIVPFSPEITLLKNTEKDQIVEHQDHQELSLWSYNEHKNLDGINFIAMRLTFQNDTTIIFDIPIKNGFLFGDDSPERIIYIDK